MVELTVIEETISELIQNIVGSNMNYVGFIAVFCFLLYGVWSGHGLITLAIVFVPLVVVLGSAGLIPAWVIIPMVVAMGVVVALAGKSYLGR